MLQAHKTVKLIKVSKYLSFHAQRRSIPLPACALSGIPETTHSILMKLIPLPLQWIHEC